MRTIGIDLALTSAHKAVVADTQGRFLTPVFTFHTTPDDLEHLLARAREDAPDTPLQVVMEPTGMAVRRITARAIPPAGRMGSEGNPWVNDSPRGESQQGQQHVVEAERP
jgi:transposase